MTARARHALRVPNRSAVEFHTDFAVRRSQQRRVPHQPSLRRRLHQISPPAKTSTALSRDSLSAIIRLSFALRSEAAQLFQPSRSIDLRFGTFHSGRALALRTLASTRDIPSGASTGPATLDRRCARNVVANGEYSKWFFCLPTRLYDGFLRPATARRMPARSALAGPSGASPAAVIKALTSPCWPCPTSTARTPCGASSRAACGISAR